MSELQERIESLDESELSGLVDTVVEGERPASFSEWLSTLADDIEVWVDENIDEPLEQINKNFENGYDPTTMPN